MDSAPLVDLDARVARDGRDGATGEYAIGPGSAFGRSATATVGMFGADGTALSLDIDFSS